ncbi:MAG: hypothetical protein QXD05_00215 [Candidatus Pacearchaeota archaeon]
MTPKLDRMCIDFIKRIPDQLRSNFTPGSGALPSSYLLDSKIIVDYINRGMQDLFGNFWKMCSGEINKFISIFPELVELSGSVSLQNGNYTITSPYRNFYKLIGAYRTADNIYFKVKDATQYTLYFTQKYDEYKVTVNNPVIIQVNQMLAVFPQTMTGQIKFQYIKVPLNPVTGEPLEQNGEYDSPFFEHWNKEIVDLAYLRFLQETNQTT